MLKYLNIKMNQGMTLIEVVLAIALIAIISSMVVINPRPQTNLNIAAQQLVSDLRRAQNMAMATAVRGVSPNEYVPCGYGINFSASSADYILFEDFDGIPPDITCPDDNERDAGGNEDIETISLPDGIEIENSGDALFLSPAGTKSTPDDITITLRKKNNPAVSKDVIITGDGNIW